METIAFARGVPSPDMLPVDELRQAADRALGADAARILSYGGGGGYPPLREWLAARHGVPAGQVVVTPGSLQGFALLLEVLRHAAGGPPRVIVENPTYDRPLLLLGRAGFDVRAIAMDADGLDVDELAEVLADGRPSLLYTIPTFQNPGGSTLVAERRQRLLELAREHGTIVLEDDPYGALSFGAPPPPTLFEQRGDAQVIYSSSFSKTISPGLRVGYFVLPADLAPVVERQANDTYISATLLGQATVHEFVTAGGLDPNIARCREQLRLRCDAMCAALDEHAPEIGYERPGGGYFLWARLPGGVQASELLQVAGDHGVSFVPGEAFGSGQEHALRLAFSYPSVDEVGEGVRRLAAALRTVPART